MVFISCLEFIDVIYSQSNAGESESLYNFHEAVSLLIETEEQLIDEHKTSIEVSDSLKQHLLLSYLKRVQGAPGNPCCLEHRVNLKESKSSR